MINSLFQIFTSKHYTTQTNAAIIIQQHYKTYVNNVIEEKLKLIKQINDTISNSYNIVTIDKTGNTIIYKEQMQTSCDEDAVIDDEYAYYLQERKRIKS
jgi:hypothetical protein